MKYALNFGCKQTPLSESNQSQKEKLHWWISTSLYPKFLWVPKGGSTCYLSAGIKQSFNSPKDYLNSVYCSNEEKCLSIRDFSSKRKEKKLWEGFPSELHWIPEFETALVSASPQQQSLSTLFASHSSDFFDLMPEKLNETPNQSHWESLIKEAKKQFQNHQIDKVVLARQSQIPLEYRGALETLPLLLEQKFQDGHCYAILLSNEKMFFGCTPERLFVKKNSLLETSAIAGTITTSSDPGLDEILAQKLLLSPKDQKEFSYVSSFICDLANQLGSNPRVSKTEILKAGLIQHLKQDFQFSLDPSVDAEMLLKLFHPTPATGGSPRKKSMEFIDQFEPFERGWYASPIGWFQGESAEFFVALRCGLVNNHTLSLFAGTGIIDESLHKKEWKELNDKIEGLLNLFKYRSPSYLHN